MGKGLKEFQLYDSRRLRKKPQDAQDDVTELFDLFHARFWGWKGHRIWTPKGGPPQCHVLGVPNTPQVQAQIASRARRLLNSCPILPAHRKLPWPGYKQGMRLFTKMLVAHPLVGISRPPEIAPADLMKSAGYMTGSMFIREHSAGSYAGMVLEKILAEFPDIEGRAILAAIALPHSIRHSSLIIEYRTTGESI